MVTTFSQHFVVTCCDHARSNGHNNLSTFQEQNKCCDDVETKLNEFKLIATSHNIVERGGQTVTTSALNKCCDSLIGALGSVYVT